jgi:hypothetical protein
MDEIDKVLNKNVAGIVKEYLIVTKHEYIRQLNDIFEDEKYWILQSENDRSKCNKVDYIRVWDHHTFYWSILKEIGWLNNPMNPDRKRLLLRYKIRPDNLEFFLFNRYDRYRKYDNGKYIKY